MVGGDGLDDGRGQFVADLSKGALQGFQVIQRHHGSQLGDGLGHAGAGGGAEGDEARQRR